MITAIEITHFHSQQFLRVLGNPPCIEVHPLGASAINALYYDLLAPMLNPNIANPLMFSDAAFCIFGREFKFLLY